MTRGLPTRLKHAWAVLTGQIMLPNTFEEMKLMVALTKTAAALSDLNVAATALINANQADNKTLSDLQTEVASADDDTSASIAAVTASLTAATAQSASVTNASDTAA